MGELKKRSFGITGTFEVDFFFYLFGGIFASALGSFYVTLGERILYFIYGPGRKKVSGAMVWKKILTAPSHCRTCNVPISPVHLFPVLGGWIAKGKCETCRAPFPLFFSFVELFFCVQFLVNLYLLKNLGFAISFSFFLGHVLVSMMTDAGKFILDYENIPFLLIFGILCNYFSEGTLPNGTSFLVGLGFLVSFYLLFFLYPRGMGLGDVFLVTAYSFLASHPWWMFFLNASYSLALLGSFVFRKKGEKFLKKKIPLGLYLGLGIGITLLLKAHFVVDFN